MPGGKKQKMVLRLSTDSGVGLTADHLNREARLDWITVEVFEDEFGNLTESVRLDFRDILAEGNLDYRVWTCRPTELVAGEWKVCDCPCCRFLNSRER